MISPDKSKQTEKRSKKILFISPDAGGTSVYTQYHAPPLGVVRLAGYLSAKGHHGEYYDPNLYACSKKGLSLEETLKKENWDIVGFSILDETLLQDIQNIYLAKKACPNALIVAGGVEAQFNYQEILDKTPCRIVILGEGEVPMRMIADGMSYNDIPGLVVKNNAEASLSSTHDVHNLLERFQTHINFNDDEERKGKRILNDFGLSEKAKFVCLAVRDSAYLDRHKEYENFPSRSWKYHNFRDGDVDKYALAAEELARRGYYVFRMGVKVLKPLKSSNPKLIDYANSEMRSAFMDIYLGAKCNFCISTLTGFDEIPTIFRKPIVYISVVPFHSTFNIITHDEKILFTIKKHIHKKYKKELKISEIINIVNKVDIIYTIFMFQ